MVGMMENAFINVKGVAHTVTAEVEVKDLMMKASSLPKPAISVVGCWYMKDGKVYHEYNFFAPVNAPTSRVHTPLAPGKHMILYEFVPGCGHVRARAGQVLILEREWY